jgi:hypothetical protein
MKQKRLDRIKQKLDEGLLSVGIIFRETDGSGNVTEHTQDIKGYEGKPQTVEIYSDDRNCKIAK